MVSTMGPNGLFYANAVCTFGVFSAGRNLGRLASAAHRRAPALVGDKEPPCSYFLTIHRYYRAMRSLAKLPHY